MNSPTLAGCALALGVSVGAWGCKAKVEYRDNPQVVEELNAAKAAVDEKQGYIVDLEKRLSDLELKAGSGEGEVVITLNGPLPEGSIMEVKGGAGPNARAGGAKTPKEIRGNAKDEELYGSFVAALKRSRGAIKKCYQNALKKDTRLQARTVTLAIAVNYKTSGSVSSATFNPRISDQFNRCMASVAKHWKLPAMPRQVSFNYRQTLTPE